MCKRGIDWILTTLLIFILLNGVTLSLRNLMLTGGGAVRSGGKVTLRCSYDLEGAQLYSIRWYRNEDEFYRFVPKESPPAMVFPLLGVHVDLSSSNDHDVTFTGVHRQLAGDYHCEVSADAPLFHTEIMETKLEVVDVPVAPPALTVDRMRYSAGDTIRANCSSDSSYPGANITWFINEQPVNKTHTVIIPEYPEIWEMSTSYSLIEITTEEEIQYPKYQVGGSQQETFSGQLKLPGTFPEISVFTAYSGDGGNRNYQNNNPYDRTQELREGRNGDETYNSDRNKDLYYGSMEHNVPTGPTFIPLKITRVRLQPNFVGNIKIKCVATIYNVYKDVSVEREIKEETPHIAHVMGQSSAGCSLKTNTHQNSLQCFSIFGIFIAHTVWKVLTSER